MIARFIALALFAFSTAVRGEPELLKSVSPSPVLVAEAVNYYVGLGEARTYEELVTLSRARSADSRFQNKVTWLLRILYEPAATPLRAPMSGTFAVPTSMYAKWPFVPEWPLFPVAASGDTYFILADVYELIGEAESARHYLEYCRANGRFRSRQVATPTRESAGKDAEALFRTNAWKAIQWNVSVEDKLWDFEARIREFVKQQVDAI